MDGSKLQEFKDKFQVNQKLSLVLPVDRSESSKYRSRRKGLITGKYDNHFVVEYIDKLGKYTESFKYTDVLTGYVRIAAWI